MLVISRRAGTDVLIGDNILVKVLSVRDDGSVRIGVDAPKHVNIARTELLKPKALSVYPPTEVL